MDGYIDRSLDTLVDRQTARQKDGWKDRQTD